MSSKAGTVWIDKWTDKIVMDRGKIREAYYGFKDEMASKGYPMIG